MKSGNPHKFDIDLVIQLKNVFNFDGNERSEYSCIGLCDFLCFFFQEKILVC